MKCLCACLSVSDTCENLSHVEVCKFNSRQMKTGPNSPETRTFNSVGYFFFFRFSISVRDFDPVVKAI